MDQSIARGESADAMLTFWTAMDRADSPRVREYLWALMPDTARPEEHGARRARRCSPAVPAAGVPGPETPPTAEPPSGYANSSRTMSISWAMRWSPWWFSIA